MVSASCFCSLQSTPSSPSELPLARCTQHPLSHPMHRLLRTKKNQHRFESSVFSCRYQSPVAAASASAVKMNLRTPVFLFDIMDTIVRDPFYEDVPAFFGISMKELLSIKHPTAWLEFEKGAITEEELIAKFFKDKRNFDSSGLKACMVNGYVYLEGIEHLLGRLKSNGYQMHAFSNYSPWYQLIEDKLNVSKYLKWSFVSCDTGKRKPDPDAFIDATEHLGLKPSDVIFVDDQARNVEAAIQVGMKGLVFENAKKLEADLLELGILL